MTPIYLSEFRLLNYRSDYGTGHAEGYIHHHPGNGSGFGNKFMTLPGPSFQTGYGYGYYNGLVGGGGYGTGLSAVKAYGYSIAIEGNI